MIKLLFHVLFPLAIVYLTMKVSYGNERLIQCFHDGGFAVDGEYYGSPDDLRVSNENYMILERDCDIFGCSPIWIYYAPQAKCKFYIDEKYFVREVVQKQELFCTYSSSPDFLKELPDTFIVKIRQPPFENHLQWIAITSVIPISILWSFVAFLLLCIRGVKFFWTHTAGHS